MIEVNVDTPIFVDFKVFASAHLKSWDNDPVYPVLKHVQRERGLERDRALWHTLLYNAFYNLGSAERMVQAFPLPTLLPSDLSPLPTGTERRSFRGSNVKNAVEMINAVLTLAPSLSQWVEKDIGDNPEESWTQIRETFESVKWNGTWASYKWCDLLRNVHDYPITAPDIGLGGGSKVAGPVPGLARILGVEPELVARDFEAQRTFFQKCLESGIPFSGMEELETSLCDFNSMVKGHYYVGHDIDLQMDHLAGLPDEYWRAREVSFPQQFLGEKNGWKGVRKDLLLGYQRAGKINWWATSV